jgi:hypothetical protein
MRDVDSKCSDAKEFRIYVKSVGWPWLTTTKFGIQFYPLSQYPYKLNEVW